MIEDKVDFEKLREKHKEVLEDKNVQAICNWKDPLYNSVDESEEEFLLRAKKKLNSSSKYFKNLINYINSK
jgi:hypothetical protein